MHFESHQLRAIEDLEVLRNHVRAKRRLLERAEIRTTIFRGAFFITMGMLLWALYHGGLLPLKP